tara:strand:- start:55 stop:1971 length:1917 start_codon:yes stop_codon:yes gene_type:complete
MILNEAKKNVVVSGDFEQTNFKLKADPKAFNILSDKIYTNKVKAVIREISTNAYDAHVAAGNDEPFDVHLPTDLEPWFSVRDYGTGLSHQDCMEIYTTYFHSTKTDSNDYVGALGLGSKSPYSIADSFTVTSWFNGEKRVYSAYKDENDCPQFALLTSDDTDEPNGIEVSVAASDPYEFEQEAVSVYKFFDKLPNINIDSVVHNIEDAHKQYKIKTDDFASSTQWGDVTCVMGNVGYRLNRGDIEHPMADMEVVLYFNIGDLNFTPGRESLSLDDKTKNNVIAKLDLLKEGMKEALQVKLDACETYYEAKCLYEGVNRQFKRGCTYNGDDLRNAPDFPSSTRCYYTEGYSHGTKVMDVITGYYDNKTEYFWKQKGYVGRIRGYLGGSYQQNRRVILVEKEHVEAIGIDPSLVRDLDELPKVERVSSTGTVSKCKVYTWNGQDRYKNADNWNEAVVDLKDGEERIYVEINRFEIKGQKWFTNSVWHMRQSLSQTKEYIGDVKVYGVKSVLLKSKAFQNGNWISLDEYLKREMTKVAPKSISKFEGSSRIANLLCELSGVMSAQQHTSEKLSKFYELYETQDTTGLARMLESLDIKVEKSNEINDLYNEILKGNPILNLIDTYATSKTPDSLETVAELLK